MNTKSILLITLSLCSIILSSCQTDDDVINQTEDEPVLNLDLKESPVDLQGISASFAEDIPYDTKDRTKFDIWLPESSTPTGLVIYIHGGGFTSGDKSMVQSDQQGRGWFFTQDIRSFLENNIAFASINYSLLAPFGEEEEGVIKSLNDVRRAIQFMRYHSSSFNINKNKVMLAGNSAGAGASLWAALTDDLADPDNTDPVLRESTRVQGAAVRETQASYDVEGDWFSEVFEDFPEATFELYRQVNRENFLQFYGLSSDAEYDLPEIDSYREEVGLLDLISSDDPPIWVRNIIREVVAPTTADLVLHHAFHARELKEQANAVGIENVISFGRDNFFVPDPNRPDETYVEFCIRILER